jgi:outer membrane protein OmpA-like peptidoglycan-associated protein
MLPPRAQPIRLASLAAALVLALAGPARAQQDDEETPAPEPSAPAPSAPPPAPAPPAQPPPATPPAPAPAPAPKGPLNVTLDKSKVDLTEHHLELTASRNLVRVTLHVKGDSGAELAAVDRDLGSHPAGTPLVVAWTPSTDEAVARIEVFVWDADGYYKGFALTPWSISVPHEEVNFKTDSAVIADAEKPKLEASFAKVTEALGKHPEIQGVTLFIAGHTDTVGDAGYNLRLSRKRAEAIAQWFRQRGLRIAIGWEGFGEFALLVKTADNVDEPRNRRVDYILSVDEPVFKSTGTRPSWKRVP